MKRITALSTIAVAVKSALIIGRTFSASVMSNDRVMADVRQSYRSASLVVSGECIQKINSGDNAQSRILIDEVIAGKRPGRVQDTCKGQLYRGRKVSALSYGGQRCCSMPRTRQTIAPPPRITL